MNTGTFLKAVLETTQADLLKSSDKDSVAKGNNYTRYYKGLKADSTGNAETMWNVPSASEPGKMHKCYVTIIPKRASLFTVVQNGSMSAQQKHRVIADADVKCFCSCKKFQYYGMAWQLNQHGDFAGDHASEAEGGPGGEKIEPKVRNPDGKYVLCQHLVACFKGLKMAAFTVISEAKKTKVPPVKQVNQTAGNQVPPKITAPAQTQIPSKPDTDIKAPLQTADNSQPAAEIQAPAEQSPQKPDTEIKAPGTKSLMNVSEDKLKENKAIQEAALESLGKAAEQLDNEIKPPVSDLSDELEKNKPDTDIKAPDISQQLPMSDIEDAAQLDMFNVEP